MDSSYEDNVIPQGLYQSRIEEIYKTSVTRLDTWRAVAVARSQVSPRPYWIDRVPVAVWYPGWLFGTALSKLSPYAFTAVPPPSIEDWCAQGDVFALAFSLMVGITAVLFLGFLLL